MRNERGWLNVCLFRLKSDVVGFDEKCLTSRRDAGSWNQHDVMIVLRGGLAALVLPFAPRSANSKYQDEAHVRTRSISIPAILITMEQKAYSVTVRFFVLSLLYFLSSSKGGRLFSSQCKRLLASNILSRLHQTREGTAFFRAQHLRRPGA